MNTDSSVYLYSGPSGVDCDAKLAIDSIDYGTYHVYPDSWVLDESEYQSWGEQWIQDHAASGVAAGKPVVMEEYGVKTLNASIYQAWSDAVYTAKSSMQYWQFGVSSLSTADDGYTIYDTDELFTTVIAPAAEEFAELGGTSTSSAAAAATTATTTSSTAASVAGDASESVDTTASIGSSIAATSSAASESTSSAATSTTASTESSSAATTTATESSSAISAATAVSAEASTGIDTSSASSAGSTAAATTDASSTTDAVTDAPVATIATTTDTASDRCSVRRRRS
jgi:hypothetical protein